MRQTANSRSKTRSRVEIGVRRMAARYPFHAAILERFQIVRDPTIETMGVQAHGDRVRLFYAEEFVDQLSWDQLLGVLLHEVHHVLFRHIYVDVDAYPDRWARLVAEEISVNEFIAEPLPEGVITLADFPELPPMESTNERYRRLRSYKCRFVIETGSVGIGNAVGENGRIVFDNHVIWTEGHADPEQAEEVIQALIDEAAIDVGPDNVPAALKSLVGVCTQGQYLALGGAVDSCLNWQQLLRRYVGRTLRVRPVFNRPSRRMPELLGIVPGMRRQADRPKIMAVIDTSGSISLTSLEQICAELRRLAAQFTVTVVECDTVVHEVYRYRPIKHVRGRGGTNLQPPFEPAFLRKHRPDLVIYFTDGFGPAPDRPPRIPVIWCLVPGGISPACWGRNIQMDDQD